MEKTSYSGFKSFYFILIMILLSSTRIYSNLNAADNNGMSVHMKNLKSKDIHTRITAIEELGKIKDKSITDELAKELDSETNDIVRVHIIRSLGSSGDIGTIARLKKLAKEDKSGNVRAASAMSLGSSGDKTSIPELKDIILDEKENDNVRVYAAISLILNFIEEPAAVEAIKKVLESGNNTLKFAVVNNLGHVWQKKEGKLLLEIAKNDKDDKIKNLAVKILGIKPGIRK